MRKQRSGSAQKRILSCWWLLEMFSPQPVPKITANARPDDKQVIEWRPREPLPWNVLPTPPGDDKYVWRHEVYLGVYQLQDTYEWLHRVFPNDRDAHDARPPGLSACVGLMVDQHGQVMMDSVTLSSALWAVGQIAKQSRRGRVAIQLDWKDRFEGAQRNLADVAISLEGARRAAVKTPEPPHDAASLMAILRAAQEICGLDPIPELATQRIVIKSQLVSRTNVETRDFLNSLLLGDLARVWQVADGGIAPESALGAYLKDPAQIDTTQRIDVVSRPEEVTKGAWLDRLPLGRWPADPKHGLALSQQFAVNLALGDLADSRGLLGVNGPPGTGKTTMLRDVVAGNVVERARRLAKLQHPSHAFEGSAPGWKTVSGHSRWVRRLRPELTGFEMVVASANNAAVENVTAELPARGAIGPPWRDDADYFADIATCTLRAGKPRDQANSIQGWGMIAAKLGNRGNRDGFLSSFWYDTTRENSSERVPGTPRRMLSLLKDWRDNREPHRSWQEACDAFRQAEQRVQGLIRERQLAVKRLAAVQKLEADQRDLEWHASQAELRLQQIERELSQISLQAERIDEEYHHVKARYERELVAKPGLLEVLFSLGRASRQWRERYQAAADQLTELERRKREWASQETELRDRMAKADRNYKAKAAELNRAATLLGRVRSQSIHDRRQIGLGYPDDSWVGERRQLHAPWLEPELDAARSELFLEALKLHRDFLANCASMMVGMLAAALDVVAGRHPPTLSQETLLASWQLFFLVVPVISTTFASVGRMFGGLEAEALGWLLIDEAGQAAPQQAVGALWRAKRAVVVGDPLQLTPIVTIPQKMQLDIAASLGVDGDWLAPPASVQALADRVTRYGTTLPQGERELWVSAPLTVHRRCDDPMYTLCNQIAYNGLMVRGIHRHPNEAPWDGVPASQWLHEPAPEAGKHLQPNQIQRLLREMRSLRERGVDYAQMIAISPFREVADELNKLGERYKGLTAGTIHTAQGREADVVFLVLGGAPDRPGAKAWAAEAVNLVNVAVSRARRRLYVIGDRGAWRTYNYFRQLSEILG